MGLSPQTNNHKAATELARYCSCATAPPYEQFRGYCSAPRWAPGPLIITDGEIDDNSKKKIIDQVARDNKESCH
jgi:hypothetical protein